MRDFLAFALGAWTVGLLMVAHEGVMPGWGWVWFGMFYVLMILGWLGYRLGANTGRTHD